MKAEMKENQLNGIEMYALAKDTGSRLYKWTGNYYCAEPMSDTFAVGDVPAVPWIDEVMFLHFKNCGLVKEEKGNMFSLTK